MKDYPPLLKYILDVQTEYKTSIVACEIGSFFEILEIDGIGHAKEAAQILDIVLTKKNKADPSSPYMAGFPVASAKGYFKKLADAGKTVIVITQDSRGKKSDKNKGVGRRISQIISPGTVLDLPDFQENYLCCLIEENESFGISLVDVTTGTVLITEKSKEELPNFLAATSPSEFIIPKNFKLINLLNGRPYNFIFAELNSLKSAGAALESVYELDNPTSNKSLIFSRLGLDQYRLASLSLANLLNYLTTFNTLLLKKISFPKTLNEEMFLNLSKETILSLDLFDSEKTNKSLFNCLNKCKTAMGKRKLKEWIFNPCKDPLEITRRHDLVEGFLNNSEKMEELKSVYDLARLIRKATLQAMSPHEIYFLSESIDSIITLNKRIRFFPEDILLSIDNHIRESINIEKREFGLTYDFFKNLPPEMENLNNEIVAERGKIEGIRLDLQNKLGSEKLRVSEKIDSVKITGPKGLSEKANHLGIKFTKKASDIEIHPEKFNELVDSLLSKIAIFNSKAETLWLNYQESLSEKFSNDLYILSELIGEYDALNSFSIISEERNYSRPKLRSDKAIIDLKKVRHPVVEWSNDLVENYIPNDLSLSSDAKRTLVLYGPNSSGKSTFIKSIASSVIMNQIGCFVPAEEGSSISIFDNIFTRATSSDNLSEGQSTFVVEMNELNSALMRADESCLYIFDEIGRGTDSSDGEGISFGTIKFLEKRASNCLTLFATHYHGLYEKIREIDSILVKHVSCLCTEDGELVFFRALSDGPGEGSYGIEVAKSCGIPKEIIQYAKTYKKDFFPIKKSKYNSKLEGSHCELCKENQARETHHIVEQNQGKTKTFNHDGIEKSINDFSNIVLLCPNCHEKITRKELKIVKKIKTSSGFLLETVKL